MRRSTLAIILALLTASTSQSQPTIDWQRDYTLHDNDTPVDFVNQPEDGLILAGLGYDNNPENGGLAFTSWIMKTTIEGDSVWAIDYVDSSSGGTCDLTYSPGVGIVSVGTMFRGNQRTNVLLRCTSLDGQPLWSQTSSLSLFDAGRSVCCFGESGFIVAGMTWSQSTLGYLIRRTDAASNSIWYRTGFGRRLTREVAKVIATADGGMFLAGLEAASVAPANEHFYAAKLNARGDTLWTRTFYGLGRGICYDAVESLASEYLLVGHTYAGDQQPVQTYAVLLSADGDTIWTRTYPTQGESVLRSGLEVPDAGYLLGGYLRSDDGRTNLPWIIRTDPNGDTLWTWVLRDSTAVGGQIASLLMADHDSYYLLGKKIVLVNQTGKEHTFLAKTTPDTTIPNLIRRHATQPTDWGITSTYPNPFNSTITIQYQLPSPRTVEVKITDLSGRFLDQLDGGWKVAGSHEVRWNAESAATGIYLVQLVSGSSVVSRKVVLLK